MDIQLPIEDATKIGGASAGGLGFMFYLARLLRGDLRRAEEAQTEVNRKVWKKCDEIAQKLVDHQIDAAKNFISRDEFSAFRTHMDDQFEKTRAMIFQMLQEKK